MLGCYPAPVKVSFIKHVASFIVNANHSVPRLHSTNKTILLGNDSPLPNHAQVVMQGADVREDSGKYRRTYKRLQLSRSLAINERLTLPGNQIEIRKKRESNAGVTLNPGSE